MQRTVAVIAYFALVLALGPLTFSPAAHADTSIEEARSLARLYSAAFDRLPKVDGLNFWVDSFEAGRSIQSIAADFSNSDEFRDKYGPLSDRAFIEQLFRNVLGREGVQNGIDFWTGRLEAGRPRGEILAAFADSPENVVKTAAIFAAMRQDGAGDWLFTTLFPGGMVSAMLNGPVVGASLEVAAVDALETPLLSTSTSTSTEARNALGSTSWNALSSSERLALLGTAAITIAAEPAQWYLVTVSGGSDVDNDRNGQRDSSSTAVAGTWHALMTGEQLQRSGYITPMSEALYQQVLGNLDSLSPTALQSELDRLAGDVVEDVNGDGVANYEDVIAWSRFLTPDRLVAAAGDLDRLALAVQQAKGAATLSQLGARVVDAPAQVSLEDTSTIKRSPDGTCEGRGAVVTSFAGESITTKPPTNACGENDTGEVEATQSQTTGRTLPGPDGLPKNVEVGCAKFALTGITDQDVLTKLDLKNCGGGVTEQGTGNPDKDKSDRIKAKYELLKQAKAGASGLSNGGLAVSGQRRIYGAGSTGVGSLATETEQFDNTLTDAISYGALAASWTSCLVYDVLAALAAQGQEIPTEVWDWAVSGCTSALVEVDTWVEEAPAAAVETFEEAVPAVQLDGCADCYTYVASPADGQMVYAGDPVQFTGVGPASSLGQRWLLGDGNAFDGWSVEHVYEEPGSYIARFEVDYADGTQGLEEVQVQVAPDPDEGCTQPPIVTASSVDWPLVKAIELRRETTTYGANCTESYYRWDQVGGSPLVNIEYENCDFGICGDGFFIPQGLTEDTTLTFQVTVWDSDGRSATDLVQVFLGAETPPAPTNYIIDNGIGNLGVGCSIIPGDPGLGTNTLWWANHFDVIPGKEVLTELLVAVGSEQDGREVIDGPILHETDLVGRNIDVYVYSDTYYDLDFYEYVDALPEQGDLLVSAQSTITHYRSDTFNVIDIPDTYVSGGFYIVVSVQTSTDEPIWANRSDTGTHIGESWVKADCNGNTFDWANTSSYAGSGVGNFMIRANGIPGEEPQ